ncbi:hypothetical protein [Nannocystis pusilla]|uniref:hypothetical protein n=1 Tax=Nannocystis pusilla TaxID=889268 RepID=UPI003B77604E
MPACTYPKFLGEEPTDGEATTEDIITASASSQSSATSTGVVTGDPTTSTGVVTGDPTTIDPTTIDPTTCADGCPGGAPGGPIEKCLSEFNEEYWCECTEGDIHPCGGGRVSVCLAQDAVVFTHTRWTTCGTCEPGQQRACDAPAGRADILQPPRRVDRRHRGPADARVGRLPPRAGRRLRAG